MCFSGHSALTRYFFGKDSNKKLTLDDFVVFMDGLKEDVFKMEVGGCVNVPVRQ